ncbi:MAG: septal ring lytic transglycosylase RlpA family protein [Spirochaetales bacterium]|nr:septal ring lytic transglycosylase RlpA family protein [Spirochaetales bacterium]
MKFLALLLLFSLTSLLYGMEEEGYASWYAGKFQGRLTASGEVFDTNKLTAAHKTLPFGTLLRVTNTANGKTVEVRVNDRGPFVEGRIIDLSRAAAEALDMTRVGVAPVTIQVLSMPDIRLAIQVAAYSNKDNADNTLNHLTAAGIKGTLETTAGGVYRIVIPDLPEDEAPAVLFRVKAAGYPSAFLRGQR